VDWDADIWDDDLTSTLDMIRCAFPDGILPGDYLPLLGALLKRMEPWYVGRVVYLHFGKGQDEALSDAWNVYLAPPDSGKVAGIVQQLQPCNYKAWFEEWEFSLPIVVHSECLSAPFLTGLLLTTIYRLWLSCWKLVSPGEPSQQHWNGLLEWITVWHIMRRQVSTPMARLNLEPSRESGND
jgi:hypothetical protein